MVEIAISLAVIGFALVAIVGVLPIGMNVQKENREETIINFDANYLMDAIRNGAQGLDNLTNYVIVITNQSRLCNSNGILYPASKSTFHIAWYTTKDYSLDGNLGNKPALTNGAVIVGLLSYPKYTLANTNNGDCWSNFITADFRAITGSPMDQGTSQSSKDFAFSYRVAVEVVPSASYPFARWDTTSENFTALADAPRDDGSVSNNWPAAKSLQNNLNEIRLRFRWPVLPPGERLDDGEQLPGAKVGNGSQVFRTSAGGWLQPFSVASSITTNVVSPPGLYWYIQPQSYAQP